MCKRQIFIVLIGLFVSMFSITFGQKAEKPLTNADVVTMVKADLPESTIILAIQQGTPNFDTSPTALVELKNQGASSKILDAILQAQAKVSNKSESIVSTPVKAPIPKLEYKLFTFEIKQCTLFGKRLTCEILITNNDRDKDLQIYYASNTNSSKAIDDSGNEYEPNKIQFGSKEGGSYTRLVTGIPVKLILIFDDLPQSTNSLRLLQISANFEKKDYFENPSAQFRNVPVSITTPVSDGKTLRAYEKEFSFELKSCRKVGKLIVCSVEVKNTSSKEIEIILKVSCVGGDRSRLIDDNGNEYLSTEGSIGNEIITSGGFGGRCFARGKLASGGIILMTAKFDNAADVNVIKLLRLKTGYPYSSQFDVDFRDVPLTISK